MQGSYGKIVVPGLSHDERAFTGPSAARRCLHVCGSGALRAVGAASSAYRCLGSAPPRCSLLAEHLWVCGHLLGCTSWRAADRSLCAPRPPLRLTLLLEVRWRTKRGLFRAEGACKRCAGKSAQKSSLSGAAGVHALVARFYRRHCDCSVAVRARDADLGPCCRAFLQPKHGRHRGRSGKLLLVLVTSTPALTQSRSLASAWAVRFLTAGADLPILVQ